MILCSYCSWQIRQKSTVQYGRSLNARPGQRKQMDFYFRHKGARDHLVPALVSRAIRIFPHAPPIPIAHVARARSLVPRLSPWPNEGVIIAWDGGRDYTRHVSNQNYASPRAASRGLALTYVFLGQLEPMTSQIFGGGAWERL